MKFPGAPRIHQLVTGGVGILLTAVMGAVLILGLRLATQMTAHISALQNASVLQTYPAALARELTALRDRLEARAYTGQVFADLGATNARFDHDLRQLSATDFGASQELHEALLLWRQYAPVVNPVVTFSAQPYMESDAEGSVLSPAGRAQLFARENAPRLQKHLADAAATVQRQISASATRLRLLLSAGVLATLALAAVAAYLQITRTRHERAPYAARRCCRADWQVLPSPSKSAAMPRRAAH
jgi:hypothetical protein